MKEEKELFMLQMRITRKEFERAALNFESLGLTPEKAAELFFRRAALLSPHREEDVAPAPEKKFGTVDDLMTHLEERTL